MRRDADRRVAHTTSTRPGPPDGAPHIWVLPRLPRSEPLDFQRAEPELTRGSSRVSRRIRQAPFPPPTVNLTLHNGKRS